MSESICIQCGLPAKNNSRNTQYGSLHDKCWDAYFASHEQATNHPEAHREVDEPGTGVTSSYGTARGVAAFIGFLGWVVVLGGASAMVYAASQGLGVLGVLSGIGIMIAGFLQIMGAHVVTATLDNADHTREILALLKAKTD